jgi:hypothetical protein
MDRFTRLHSRARLLLHSSLSSQGSQYMFKAVYWHIYYQVQFKDTGDKATSCLGVSAQQAKWGRQWAVCYTTTRIQGCCLSVGFSVKRLICAHGPSPRHGVHTAHFIPLYLRADWFVRSAHRRPGPGAQPGCTAAGGHHVCCCCNLCWLACYTYINPVFYIIHRIGLEGRSELIGCLDNCLVR